MDTIIDKLSQIEEAAVGILTHTEIEKKEYEDSIKAQREEFDTNLATETAATIEKIRSEAKSKLDSQLEKMKTNHELALKTFQEEYDNNHTSYATQIFRRITTI